MRRNSAIRYSIFSAFVFLFFSCEKDSTFLITDTDYGEYFSCKVNGNVWTPAGVVNPLWGVPLIWVISGRPYYNRIQIITSRTLYDQAGNRTTDEFIDLEDVGFNTNDYKKINYDQPFFRAGCGLYITDTTKSNFVKTIAIDTVKRMVKGIFQLECNSDYCHDNIKITEGKFQVKY